MYIVGVKFEWDKKNLENIKKHSISFETASKIFEGVVLTRIDDRMDYGEKREISIGEVEGIVVVVVAHMKRLDKTRIISARKVNKKEREIYYESK